MTNEFNLSEQERKLIRNGLRTRILLAERVDGVITKEHQAYIDLLKKMQEKKQNEN
jgi:hypothetical protein